MLRRESRRGRVLEFCKVFFIVFCWLRSVGVGGIERGRVYRGYCCSDLLFELNRRNRFN